MDISLHHVNISLTLFDYIMFAIIALGQAAFTVWVVLRMARRRSLLRGPVLLTFKLHWVFVWVCAAQSLAALLVAFGVLGIAVRHLPVCKGNLCLLAGVSLFIQVGFLSAVSVLMSPFVTRNLVVTEQGIVSMPVTARWPQIKRVEFIRHFFKRRIGLKVYIFWRLGPVQLTWYAIDEQAQKVIEGILAEKVTGYQRPPAAP